MTSYGTTQGFGVSGGGARSASRSVRFADGSPLSAERVARPAATPRSLNASMLDDGGSGVGGGAGGAVYVGTPYPRGDALSMSALTRTARSPSASLGGSSGVVSASGVVRSRSKSGIKGLDLGKSVIKSEAVRGDVCSRLWSFIFSS